MAIQKARITSGECADIEQAARNSGWRTAIGTCTITEAEGKSAGVAICGRTHIGMKNSICDEAWPNLPNQRSMLKHVTKDGYHALIDTGALITGLSNFEVACFLLDEGLEGIDGVAFLNSNDQKWICWRNPPKVSFLSGPARTHMSWPRIMRRSSAARQSPCTSPWVMRQCHHRVATVP